MHIDAFKIGNTNIRLSDDSYAVKYSSVEYTQTTEAGTVRRDTVRVGFLSQLSISIKTDNTVKAVFDSAVKEDSLTLTIWDDFENSSTTWTCFISDYSASLIRDTSNSVFWELNCTFSDLEAN